MDAWLFRIHFGVYIIIGNVVLDKENQTKSFSERIFKIKIYEGNKMNREQLEIFLNETYNAEIDHPWMKYPNYTVFRHSSNQKWFALIMDVPKKKLGIVSDEILNIVNFKCDPLLIGSLRTERGFFPAYHMNKANWITVSLDGTVADDKIKMLADMSYVLTSTKTKKPRRRVD